MQSLWETVWRVLRRMEMNLPYDSAIPLLGIYPQGLKPNYQIMHAYLCFIAAQFTIAKLWNQPRCPSTDEWITRLWDRYTMEFYSAVKIKIMSFAGKWMELENIMLSEISQSQRVKGQMFSLIGGG